MSDPETVALGRAALVLLVASLARWGWDAAGSPPVPAPDHDAEALLERSRAAARSDEARSRPLGSGERIDPNTAPEEALDRLPGIGPATARALVRSREREGPFRGPGDLTRVRGVGPAALERLAPYLDFPASSAPAKARPPSRAPPLDINRAPPGALEALPGIGPALAGRIVATRSQKPFASVEDLERVPGIGPATVARLRPLVVVGR